MFRSLFLFASLSLALPLSAAAQTWQEIYEKDDVTVSKMDVEGSPFVAFKGDTVVDGEVDQVLYVLMDNDHRIEWVDRLYDNYILERTSPHDYVLYQAFELPAIFANRDYVYRGVVTRDADSGVVTLKMSSVEHPEAPETVGVRANLVNSQYVLTPQGDGSKTRIEVEIMTDPEGYMAAWLVNLIQRSWPVDTLNGLRGQIDKPFTGRYPLPGVEEEAPALAADAPAADAAPVDDSTAAESAEVAGDAEAPAGDAEAPAATEDGGEGAAAEADIASDDAATPAEPAAEEAESEEAAAE